MELPKIIAGMKELERLLQCAPSRATPDGRAMKPLVPAHLLAVVIEAIGELQEIDDDRTCAAMM